MCGIMSHQPATRKTLNPITAIHP